MLESLLEVILEAMLEVMLKSFFFSVVTQAQLQSPDFYAILPSRMVGRSEEKSRKILMEIPALLS